MATIKVGIIGTGGMANSHAGRFNSIRGCQVVACLDVIRDRAQAFAERHGIKHVCTRVADVLAEVDAVSVVTPDAFHVPISIEVLRAGKHLLCEKPLATSLAEARKLMTVWNTARRKGLIGMVNFSHRQGQHFIEAQRLVQSGRLGDLRYVRSNYLQSWLSSDCWGSWTTEKFLWRVQTAKGSDGALGDLGCHILDFATGVAGPIKRLNCALRTHEKTLPDGRQVTRHGGHALDANDTFVVEMDFADGGFGVCESTRWATGLANSVNLEVYGTAGALMCGHGNSGRGTYLQVCLGRARHTNTWTPRKLKSTPDNWQRFIKAVKTGVQDQPDLTRGAEIQAYLDACHRSADRGGAVTIRKWS